MKIECPTTLFDISYNEISGKWKVEIATSQWVQYLDKLIYDNHIYSVLIERDNISIAATDGYKILSKFMLQDIDKSLSHVLTKPDFYI